jgi:hypothetical protein
MIKKYFLPLLLLLSFCGFMNRAEAAVNPLEVPPPVPERVIKAMESAGHPFLQANREQYREARRRMRDTLFRDRGREFKIRVEGFVQDDSPWYLGKGPFQENENFHPLLLSEQEFPVYIRAIAEMVAYTGMESERWAINLLKNEFLRLLKELEQARSSQSFTAGVYRTISTEEAYLIGQAAIIYDLVYQRFDTVDRHEPNNRFKQIRDELAAYCSVTDPSKLSATERVVYGSSLGLATALCVSIYPYEWRKEANFSQQAFLPDLYRAVRLTRSGMENMISRDMHIQAPLAEIEDTMLLALPWIDCMRRMGYPLVVRQGTFSQIYRGLENHRLPESAEILVPYLEFPLNGPWIPQTEELLWTISPLMYPEKQPASVISNPLQNEPNPALEQEQRGVPEEVQTRAVEIARAAKTPSLKEMLQRFMLPRSQATEPAVPGRIPGATEAGWNPPQGLELPSVWGAVIQMAAGDDTSCGAVELWDEYGSEMDSHAYTYLYYQPVRSTYRNQREEAHLLQYPEQAFTLMTVEGLREKYLLASQAAKGSLPTATHTFDHESFLLNEGGTQWRWVHEIPAAAGMIDNTSAFVETEDNLQLSTELFTIWDTFSPSGKTYIARRHLAGVGSAYTVVAHFPNQQDSQKVDRVLFDIPDKGAGNPYQFRDWLQIRTGLDENRQGTTMEEWRQLRHLERTGKIEPQQIGILNALFSPEALERSISTDGPLGIIHEAILSDPLKPFFYVLAIEQTGREMFETKYGNIPIEGVRLLEWKQGLDLVAINMGETIDTPFIQSDAEMALVSWDRSFKGLFYLMVNGSYLKVKFTPTDSSYTLLADTKGKKLSAAWSTRKVHTTAPPPVMSVFYAPRAVGFECPGSVIKYGLKGRQVTVWGHDPEATLTRK